MIRKQKRDWFRILRDLMDAGYSMSQVARSCGRDKKTVFEWSERGGEPRDSDARIVLSLYARFCPEKYMAHEREFRIAVPGEAEVPVVIRMSRPRVPEPGQPDLFEGGLS